MFETIPHLGVGIGWRSDLGPGIVADVENVTFCEVISEHYINGGAEKLNQARVLAGLMPVVPHGIDLSIGTAAPVDEGYLHGLKELCDAVDAPWFSDHLCFTRVPGFSIGQLTPLPFSEETVETVVRKAKAVKERIGRPFALENITYYFRAPAGSMSEAEFISQVADTADIGLLLDVTNVFINSQNHKYDPYRFLNEIPLERVIQLHLAGGVQQADKWVDTHTEPVPDAVYDLVEYILPRAPVKGVLLERDDKFPESFEPLSAELARMMGVVQKHNADAPRRRPERGTARS